MYEKKTKKTFLLIKIIPLRQNYKFVIPYLWPELKD